MDGRLMSTARGGYSERLLGECNCGGTLNDGLTLALPRQSLGLDTEVRHFGVVFGGFRSVPRCESRTCMRSEEIYVNIR